MWCPFGQFTLTYYTDQVADADITTLVGTIPAASNIPTAVASNLSSLRSTLESEKTIAAYNALAAAITAANSLSPTYVLFTTIKGNVLALKTQTSKFSARTGSSAFNNLDSDVNDAQDVADAATTIAGIEAAIDDLRTAAFTFANAAGINTNDYIDMTDAIIINPTVSVNVDGWTVADKVGGTGPTTNYGETEFYNATFDFYQNLTLPRGTYEFGVTGFHRAGDHSTYFYAGRDVFSSAVLRRVRSLAFLAASLARNAFRHFSMMGRAWAGFSSRNANTFSDVTVSTNPLMSVLPSFVFVWPSNWGSVSLTEMMAVNPSRLSSPVRGSSLSFISFAFLA